MDNLDSNTLSSKAAIRKLLILYVHDYSQGMRETIKEHIFSFETLADTECLFINVLYGIPSYAKSCTFDGVVIHTTLLAQVRWASPHAEAMWQSLSFLKNATCPKIALPQDEFIGTTRVDEALEAIGVDHIFSVAKPSEWPKIYPRLCKSKCQIHEILTGYLSDDIESTVTRLEREDIPRSICIGYRAWKAEEWLGRHGMLKTRIANIFAEGCQERGIDCDISTKESDVFYGLDWYRFMLRCRYMIGVEGGSSLLDVDGSIRLKTHQYLKKHPNATFEQVEANCFPGQDGSLDLRALSPRHLEACVSKTCQVLIEGEYNGILQPWKHYIPVKADFSNMPEVFDLIKKDELRHEIVERAYHDVVQSKKYIYSKWLNKLAHSSSFHASTSTSLSWVQTLNLLQSTATRSFIATKQLVKACLPEPLIQLIRTAQ